MSSDRSSGIFLSYRRNDTGPYMRLLELQLTHRFPHIPVFVDLDSVELGADFTAVIAEAIESSALFICLIGTNWFGEQKGEHRRLEDPDDPVRFEIRTALNQDVPVLPVVIGGAQPPGRGQLPTELVELAQLNALPLTYERLQEDSKRLLNYIQRVLMTASSTQKRRTSIKRRSAREAAGQLRSFGIPVTEAAFRNAVQRGDPQAAALLVDAGIPVDTQASVPDGYITKSTEVPAVLAATMYGHIDLTLELIERGAAVNVSDSDGTTPLIIAAHRGYGQLVTTLLDIDAIVDATDIHGSTPLMKAADRGHVDIVSMLIVAGADLDKRDQDGRTALFRLADKLKETAHYERYERDDRRIETGRRLLAAGADVSLTSKEGITAPQLIYHFGGDLMDLFFDRGT